jgi:arylformamidase
VIIVDYDLCPNKTLEEIVDQIKDCFMWISNYVKKNSINSLSIAGHSAGAHLLACGLTQNFVSSLDNVKLSNYFISGIYYLNELKDLETSNPNGILSLNDDNWKKLSPQFYDYSHLESSNVKNYVIAGADESKMFVKHSTKFANEPLKDTNVKLMIMENIDHFDVMEKFIEADYELTKLVLENAL